MEEEEFKDKEEVDEDVEVKEFKEQQEEEDFKEQEDFKEEEFREEGEDEEAMHCEQIHNPQERQWCLLLKRENWVLHIIHSSVVLFGVKVGDILGIL